MAGGVKNYVAEVDAAGGDKLRAALAGRGWEIDAIPYARFRAKKDKTTIAVYESGKLVVQGKGTEEIVQFLIEPDILGKATLGYEREIAKEERPDMFRPHAGIDESGKGDYFGPLVVAAVYVDGETSQALFDAGVADSKTIGSDKRIANLAGKIKAIVGDAWSVVPIGPSAYNRLYDSIGNVNKLLAWGHARVLENLLEKVPGCPRAVSDQFGRKETVLKALLKAGRTIELEQYPKAEKDIAVAAASILARDEFVRRLERLGSAAGQKLPKGAGANVIAAGRAMIKTHGRGGLAEFAKTHFKTTDNILFG
ncbi:MAG: ribonuclease HIII [Lentisphaeria bacterium]|nr:ribonuclease HIII [Lentisphaeria bacterium]